jgi:hypothetical protein
MTTNLDAPIIAYNNLLSTSGIAVPAGTINPDTPIDRLWDADMLRPCYFTPDGSGQVIIEITPAQPISCVILGSSRNDPAGYIAGATSVKFDALSVVGFGDQPFGYYGFGDHYTETITHDLSGAAASRMLRFMPTCTKLTITFSGVVGQLAFPELFVGFALEMPWMDLNYDPYAEVSNVAIFEAESGREYSRLRFRRVELEPHWSVVPLSMWGDVDAFRETLETRSPFWFAWMPETAPTEVYLVKHVQPTAPFPIKSAKHRSFALKLKEVI